MPVIPKTNGNRSHITFPAERHSHRGLATKKISVTIRGPQCEEIIRNKTIHVKMSLVHDGLVGL